MHRARHRIHRPGDRLLVGGLLLGVTAVNLGILALQGLLVAWGAVLILEWLLGR